MADSGILAKGKEPTSAPTTGVAGGMVRPAARQGEIAGSAGSLAGFRLLMQTSLDALLLVHVHSDRIVETNDAASALLEMPRESLVGRSTAQMPFTDLTDQAREHLIRTVIHDGAVRDQHARFVSQSGRPCVCSLSAHRARLDGDLYIVVACRDVTESQRLRGLLEHSQERFGDLFAHMVSGCVLLECSPRQPGEPPCLYCVQANPAFSRLTGVPAAEITGRAITDILGSAERSWVEPMEEVITTGRPAYFVKYSRRLRKWFEVSAYSPAAGQVACTFSDVTQGRRTQRQLAKARAELELVNQTKDRFITTLSHELRTPLMPILTAVSSLETDPSLPVEVKEDLAMIRRNAEMEARLIQGLLDLTQISGSNVTLRRQPMDLLQVLRDAADAARALLDARALRVEWLVETDQRTVNADPVRLRQVFANLLKNAIQHTPPNGQLSLRIEPRPGRCLAAHVSDTGEGIPPALLASVFDPFHQGAHRPGSRHGTLGLGLTVCRRIVELHGGRIQAHSDGPGQGACFTVILPLAAATQTTP